MAWFLLKDQSKRGLRKGIHLRIRDLPYPLMDSILRWLPDSGVFSGKMKIGQIDWIKISGILPDKKVRLEVWTSTHEDRLRYNESFKAKKAVPMKYTVLGLVVDENEEWVCESDVGRGLVRRRKKKS